MAKKLSDIDAILTSESESVKPYKYRAKVLRGNDVVLKEDYNGKPIKKWACGYYQQAVMLAEKLNEQAPKPEVFEEGEKVARKCSVTGEGMNEGWIANEGEEYFKYEEDALAWCKENGYKTIKKAYEEDVIYWTEWDANEDHEYIVRNGKLVEVEEENIANKRHLIIQKDFDDIEINGRSENELLFTQGDNKIIIEKSRIKTICTILLQLENE